MPLFSCTICSSLFATQKELTKHAYGCAVRFGKQYLEEQDKQTIVQDKEKGNFDGLNMSGSSLKTPTNNMAGVSGITPKEPVTYDRYPYEPMDELRTAWINIMQLLNEAKMPRKYQRQLVSVLNNQVLSHVREGPFANRHFQSPDTYRRMIKRDNDSTTK